MFTLDEINAIHDNVGKRATLPEYLKALRGVGVERYDSFIMDGHSEYYNKSGEKLVSSPVHAVLAVAATGDVEEMRRQLQLHEQGKTDYFEMSRGLAQSGVEKWTFDTGEMTITYYDKTGKELLVEKIE